jgi:hypothetical protein
MSLKVKISFAVWLIIGAGWYFWLHRNGTPLEPIVVADGAVTIRNQTASDWQNVRIWVNEHYSGGARAIPAGGFVREPLSRFVAAQGQTINAATTRIDSVVVLATDANGTKVRVVLGKPFWH